MPLKSPYDQEKVIFPFSHKIILQGPRATGARLLGKKLFGLTFRSRKEVALKNLDSKCLAWLHGRALNRQLPA